MRLRSVVAVLLALTAACSPGEGPKSIPLPTSADTTTTSTSTSTSTTVATTTTTVLPARLEATIRRTTDGVPHITGADIESVTFAQGWVSAEDHGCTLIDQINKVYGVRSVNLGPGTDGENVESDFAWRAIDIVSIATADYDSASAALVGQFEAFTEGWNTYVSSVGPAGLSGYCAGAEWVRTIQPVELYVYARSIALLASSGALADLIASAQPPEGETELIGLRRSPATPVFGDREGLGSNAWAIGSERVEGGSGGLLVGNPHFPWEGELRFAEVHLTVPGEVDIYGAQLIGLPGVGIGFTAKTPNGDGGVDGVAWTHTVSAGHRFTAYTLDLDPESPTTYLVDGEARAMSSTTHEVEVLRADGSIDVETRTLWSSEYGPIIDFPGFGWTESQALTFRDANIGNDEFLEQYREMALVRNLDDLQRVHEQYQAVPLFNTIATGADGRVWYADTSATPNLSDEAETLFLESLFVDPITKIAYDSGVILLDGSDSRFVWEESDGARDPGLVPFAEMPQIELTDHVFNANDSYWVPHADMTIATEHSVAHGRRNSPLSLRTRQNAAVLRADDPLGLTGGDGVFTGVELRDAVFDNSAQSALLLRPALVRACRAQPVVDVDDLVVEDVIVLPAEVVDLSAACSVLADWDGRFDLDRAGPILWRETISQLDGADFERAGPLFQDAFDPAAPTLTPSVPTENSGVLLDALARSVQLLTKNGFAVDTTLGATQFTERSGTRIPIHGGTGQDGVTNIVTWSDSTSSSETVPTRGEQILPGSELRGDGYAINYGTSFVMAVDYTGDEVAAWTMLTYGQTGDRESPLFETQTLRFSEKNWRTVAFTEDEIAADPNLLERTVSVT